MTVAELLQVLRERSAALYVEDGRLKYAGPKRAPDDPIRAVIDEHRSALIALFSRRSNSSAVMEQQTTSCVFCPEPLAKGDKIACVVHRQALNATALALPEPVSVTRGPVIGRHDLLALAELRDWEALPFKRGQAAGGSEVAWRTFVGWARGETLRLVLVALCERWSDTIVAYSVPSQEGVEALHKTSHLESEVAA